MIFKKTNKKICVFVDAANVWDIMKTKLRFIDYSKLSNYIEKEFQGKIGKKFYYEAYPKSGTRNYDVTKKHQFFVYLGNRLNYTVRKKPLKIIWTENNKSIEKGNFDVEITIDAIEFQNDYDIAIFLTGDSDFSSLVNYLKRKGKEIYIMSSKNNISLELKTSANGYVEILNINNIWGKTLKRRAKL